MSEVSKVYMIGFLLDLILKILKEECFLNKKTSIDLVSCEIETESFTPPRLED